MVQVCFAIELRTIVFAQDDRHVAIIILDIIGIERESTISPTAHNYKCLPKEKHRICEKGAGETSYIEGFNNMIRQRLGRFVRKTSPFSKKWANHFEVIKWFIRAYNWARKSAMI